MNPGRFYMPGNMGFGGNMMNNMMASGPMVRMARDVPRSMGLFSRITNGIRSVNWGGLLNNANKTLDVVNQAIPLVRQAGPMVNNMKSMVRIAKAFGSETNGRRFNNLNNRQLVNNATNISNNNRNDNMSINLNNNNNNNNNNIDNNENLQKKEVKNNNAPNFFV